MMKELGRDGRENVVLRDGRTRFHGFEYPDKRYAT